LRWEFGLPGMGQCANLTRFFTNSPHPSRQDNRVHTAASESGFDFTIKRTCSISPRSLLCVLASAVGVSLGQEKSRGT
jgi:hypothetical protein